MVREDYKHMPALFWQILERISEIWKTGAEWSVTWFHIPHSQSSSALNAIKGGVFFLLHIPKTSALQNIH